jgi:hypothetical protein
MTQHSSVHTAANVAGSGADFKNCRWRRSTVEHNGDLVGDTEVVRAAPPLIQQAHNVPLIMGSVAKRNRCPKTVIVAKALARDLVLLDCVT